MGLYISDFLPIMDQYSSTADKPSVVKLIIPDGVSTQYTEILGIAEGDIGFQLGNQWGSLIADTTTLQDIWFLANQASVPCWISASGQVWRGTNPISMSISMYVINWSPDLDNEEKLKALAKFGTLEVDESTWTSVRFHGGYVPDLFKDNSSTANQFLGDTGKQQEILSSAENYGTWFNNLDKDTQNSFARSMSETGTREGLITVKVGSHLKVTNMLLTRLDITPSTVEVYSPRLGSKPKPLYYRVNVSLMSSKVALSTQVNDLLGG